jgi:TolB-like protein
VVVASALVAAWHGMTVRAPATPVTLAVLPFEDLSTGATDGLVADGLTDDLITALGRSGGGLLAVISRRSVAQFKGTHTPLPQVAHALHANLILEGTIAHAGQTVRITAQLIDATTDHHLWAESYERDSVNILSLEDNVASAVASAVLEKVTGRAPPLMQAARPVAPEVRTAYLTGRFFWSRRDEPGLRQAIVYFDQAIRADSTYSPAYSGLADCYNLLGTWGYVPESTAFPAARAAALTAIRLDSTAAEAYNSLAFETYRHAWDFARAEQYFKRAIQLNPSYATAHQWYGEFLGDIKRSDESVAESRRAVELDPLSAIAGSDLADAYLHAGRDADAERELRRILALYPDFRVAHDYLAAVYFDMGRLDAYHAEVILAMDTTTRDPVAREALQLADAVAAGDSTRARTVVRALIAPTASGRSPYYSLALHDAMARQPDAAFAALDESYRRHEWWLVSVEVDPYLRLLRDDPRFAAFVKRVGIP